MTLIYKNVLLFVTLVTLGGLFNTTRTLHSYDLSIADTEICPHYLSL
jgi:hypothetical protein